MQTANEGLLIGIDGRPRFGIYSKPLTSLNLDDFRTYGVKDGVSYAKSRILKCRIKRKQIALPTPVGVERDRYLHPYTKRKEDMEIRQLVIDFIEALIPLGIAVLLLLLPQWFTKKDLKADENKGLAGTLRKIGWGLMAAGVLILIAGVGSKLVR